MSVIGIVCEYNPFHNGHKYLIDSVKKDGDTVVCVMSGNFVQRSEPAILEKRLRAKAALMCGADLVIELPLAFSVSGAQTFARGAVKLLDSLGVVDTIAFGTECGVTETLRSAAEAMENEQVHNEIHHLLKTGVTYAAARESAVRSVFTDELADILKTPNNILAVEYISALMALKSKIKPVAVMRSGIQHDAEFSNGNFASASCLRERIKSGEEILKYMPASSFSVLEEAINCGLAPSDYRKLDIAVLSFLRKATAESLKYTPDVSEGIENRIISAARTASTLSEVFDNAKTKRYTHSRIRRIVLCAFLGIKKSDIAVGLPYIRVLGFSEKGKTLLHSARKLSSLPVVMRAGDINQLSETAKRCFSLECTATDIYNLTLPKIRPCGTEMTDNLIIV